MRYSVFVLSLHTHSFASTLNEPRQRPLDLLHAPCLTLPEQVAYPSFHPSTVDV